MRRILYSVIVIFAALLAACSSAPVVPPVDVATLETEARAALARGDIVSAQRALEQLVQRTDGARRHGFQIELARIDIRLGAPEAALTRLAGILPPLPDAIRTELMAVQAEAQFALGNLPEAVRLLVDREIWLDSAEAIRDNQTRIWNGLAASSQSLAPVPPTGDATLDGWLALGSLTRLTDDGSAFIAALIDWRDAFPNHPAATGILAERLAALRGDSLRPGRIALLLPLGADGALRLQAEAIREGFFAASLSGDRENAPEVLVFDTAGGSVLAAYRAAQLENVDFIVGPLRAEEEVDVVLPEAGFIPTLALNLPSSGTATASNFFQFALSSDDEIEAIATQAIADGHRTAVILHNRDNRGRRLRDSFTAAFESRGGRVIGARDYAGDSANLIEPIEELLSITQSDARATRLILNFPERTLVYEPRRRNDIDMIFLQADPSSGPDDARLLVPLLAGSNAADIPTYASSDIFDPAQTRSDSDLNGLMIPELPMLIGAAGDAEIAAELLDRFTSRSAAYNRRLFAFGYDAYRLAEQLFAGPAARWPLEGATGRLYLMDSGRIRRVLPFAEFVGGQLRPLNSSSDFLSQR